MVKVRVKLWYQKLWIFNSQKIESASKLGLNVDLVVRLVPLMGFSKSHLQLSFSSTSMYNPDYNPTS